MKLTTKLWANRTFSMWALYLGRPFHNISQAVTMETPISFSEYQDSQCDTNGPEDKLLNYQEIVVEQWVQLSRTMSPLEGSL